MAAKNNSSSCLYLDRVVVCLCLSCFLLILFWGWRKKEMSDGKQQFACIVLEQMIVLCVCVSLVFVLIFWGGGWRKNAVAENKCLLYKRLSVVFVSPSFLF